MSVGRAHQCAIAASPAITKDGRTAAGATVACIVSVLVSGPTRTPGMTGVGTSGVTIPAANAELLTIAASGSTEEIG